MVTSTGHGFCGLSRKRLLLILQERARALGVKLDFQKQLTPDAIKQSYDNMTNVQQLDDAEVEGEAVHVYEYDTTATIMGIKADSHVKLYVGKSSGLILRQDVDGKAMGVGSQSISTYTYDAGINIQAPN